MPGATLSETDVNDWVRDRMAKYKVPKRVDFHAALPRQDSGKIFKRQLRDPFWQAAGRNI